KRVYMAPNYWENSQRFVDQFGDSDWYDKRPFSYVESVKELDKQLARVRTSPSKILHDGKNVTIFVDMSCFSPEEIEIIVTGNRLTVRATSTVRLDERHSVDKVFIRKFVLASEILIDTVTTDLNRLCMLTIKATRI
uniref:SHSP domain-containing protein n=1 Tax=Parascaris univalens TaxID=6257 RepID=A0A915BDF9_PARUN